MTKELVVSATKHETRVAVLEDDQLVEVYHQREREYSLAGSIHKGRVTRVLPGMQSAFVDLGLDRDAFLYVSDFFEDNEEYDKIVTSVEEKVLRLDKAGEPVEAVPRVPDAVVLPPAAVPQEVPPVVVRPPDRDHDFRDRRGRRTRRRKPRDRGFPESKFAPPPSAVEEEAAEAADFAILPGETLAKYRRPNGETVNREDVETVAGSGDDQAFPETPGGGEPIPADSLAAEQAWATEEANEPEEEALAEPAQNPEPVTPAAIAKPEVASPVQSELPPDETGDEKEPAGEDLLNDAGDAAVPEGGEGMPAEEPAEDLASPEEAVEGVAQAAEAESPEPARIPTSLTAALREQGDRYPHRVSRRMRRKMRGGVALDEARRSEAAPAPRSEQKTVFRTEKPGQPSISDLLREGQEIIVQIAKEPLGQKGARITSHIALPGRYVVYMPTVDHIGVSRKISSDEERLRLKRILQTHRAGIPGGFILRTAGEGRSEDELRSDMQFLYNLWLDMRQRAEKRKAPALIHHDLDVVERVLRDQLTANFKTIWVDNEEVYERTLGFVERFQPALVSRVKLYTRATPIFDAFSITQEVEKALRPKVWLKSGGYIVINQTEALVAIDVNTGKYVGKSNRLEDTIFKTNTDAIQEIVRQIRLRDLGGIIVVDFIDMDERKNRQKVMQALEEAMKVDRAPYKILQFNDFGLVAITRKRVKQSLERTLCTPCPHCEGAGYIKNVATVITEILQEARKIAPAVEGPDVMLRVHPEVGKVLKATNNRYLQELEEVLGRNVIVRSDPLLHQEKFDLA